MDNVPKEIHGVPAMTQQPLATVAKVRLLPHPIRRPGLTVKKATEMKVLTREVRFYADTKIVKKNRHVNFWHPPVCQNYISEKGKICGDKCHFRHVEAEGKLSKRSKKGGAKGSVAFLKERRGVHGGKLSVHSARRNLKFIGLPNGHSSRRVAGSTDVLPVEQTKRSSRSLGLASASMVALGYLGDLLVRWFWRPARHPFLFPLLAI